MSKKHSKKFKLNAIEYVKTHPDLTIDECAENLGVCGQTIYRWRKAYEEKGDDFHRGSGNYSSDEAKEIAHLKRELRDTKDALDVLKKAISILGD